MLSADTLQCLLEIQQLFPEHPGSSSIQKPSPPPAQRTFSTVRELLNKVTAKTAEEVTALIVDWFDGYELTSEQVDEMLDIFYDNRLFSPWYAQLFWTLIQKKVSSHPAKKVFAIINRVVEKYITEWTHNLIPLCPEDTAVQYDLYCAYVQYTDVQKAKVSFVCHLCKFLSRSHQQSILEPLVRMYVYKLQQFADDEADGVALITECIEQMNICFGLWPEWFAFDVPLIASCAQNHRFTSRSRFTLQDIVAYFSKEGLLI
jgi:hypothetical protein